MNNKIPTRRVKKHQIKNPELGLKRNLKMFSRIRNKDQQKINLKTVEGRIKSLKMLIYKLKNLMMKFKPLEDAWKTNLDLNNECFFLI